ncbi:putative ciliary rootlet coiled-coil protein-like 2 protein [Theropithecus gelada]|uniref:putative ciliary rootlet coiled-coil protein-like 2 protein n=1 Tax=Theropithecus gelada TaxID=9565 RepID=UPI000DC1A6E1|nr:putative ciliary rootlet coiled-coil protein-like 2 protein [Theropithecus gelada]
MGGRYEASQDLLGTLRKQLSDSESERRALEEQLLRLREKTNCAMQAHEDAQREVQRLRSANELLSREKSNLAHSLQVAQQQAEELRQEREKLQAAQEELRRQRDRLEEEQEDAVQDGVRVRQELERSHRQLEQLEGKRSVLAKELVEVREALSHATLQRDMLQAEKAEVAEALTKVAKGRGGLPAGLPVQAERPQREPCSGQAGSEPPCCPVVLKHCQHLRCQGYQEKAQQRQLQEQGAVEHGECLLGAPEPGHGCVPASLSATRLQLPLLGFILVALTPQMLTDCREALSCLVTDPVLASENSPMLNLPCHPVALMGRIARFGLQMASPWKHRFLNQLQAAGWQSHVPLPETHTCTAGEISDLQSRGLVL